MRLKQLAHLNHTKLILFLHTGLHTMRWKLDGFDTVSFHNIYSRCKLKQHRLFQSLHAYFKPSPASSATKKCRLEGTILRQHALLLPGEARNPSGRCHRPELLLKLSNLPFRVLYISSATIPGFTQQCVVPQYRVCVHGVRNFWFRRTRSCD